jgi:hypothetical protein
MRFPCTITHRADGRWTAAATDETIGAVEVTADDREDALSKLRNEIRYRIEYCPCSGVGDDFVELDLH